MKKFENLKLFENPFEIMVGTYDSHSIIGFKIVPGKEDYAALQPVFAHQSHSAAVHCLLPCGKLLLSGAADDMVHVYGRGATAHRTQVIMAHDGSINDLQQHNTKFIFSAGDDGQICVFRRGQWQTPRSLKGHRGGATCLAPHPSGRLLLSGGRDGALLTWELASGERVHRRPLGRPVDAVTWSPCGSRYAAVCHDTLRVFEVAGGEEETIQLEERICSVAFVDGEMLLLGLASGRVAVRSRGGGWGEAQGWAAHGCRVKAMAVLPGEGIGRVLVTCCTDGEVKLWGVSPRRPASPPLLLGRHSTGCRLTCLAVAPAVPGTQPQAEPTPEPEPVQKREQADGAKRLKFEEPPVTAGPGRDTVAVFTGAAAAELLLCDEPQAAQGGKRRRRGDDEGSE